MTQVSRTIFEKLIPLEFLQCEISGIQDFSATNSKKLLVEHVNKFDLLPGPTIMKWRSLELLKVLKEVPPADWMAPASLRNRSSYGITNGSFWNFLHGLLLGCLLGLLQQTSLRILEKYRTVQVVILLGFYWLLLPTTGASEVFIEADWMVFCMLLKGSFFSETAYVQRSWMRWTPAAMLGRNLAGDRAKFPEAPTRAQSRADGHNGQRCEALCWCYTICWYQNGTSYESRHWPLESLESEDFLSAFIMIYCEDV